MVAFEFNSNASSADAFRKSCVATVGRTQCGKEFLSFRQMRMFLIFETEEKKEQQERVCGWKSFGMQMILSTSVERLRNSGQGLNHAIVWAACETTKEKQIKLLT